MTPEQIKETKADKELPLCQWAPCPRANEVTASRIWMLVQYECTDRGYDQTRGTYVCEHGQ